MKRRAPESDPNLTLTIHKRSVLIGIGLALVVIGDKAPELLLRILNKLLP